MSAILRAAFPLRFGLGHNKIVNKNKIDLIIANNDD